MMDRRMKKTKESIFNAFTKLLSNKSYNKITVQEIIDEANVGRSTFYAHYETKDDLLNEMCQEMFQHVIASNLAKEKAHNFLIDNKNTSSLLTHILYHIKDETIHLKGLLISENGEYFWRIFRKQSSYFIKDYILPKENEERSVPENVLINHISITFEGLVKWWIVNGMVEQPEIIKEYFEFLIHPVLRSFFVE